MAIELGYAYSEEKEMIEVPDTEITQPKDSYTYLVFRGYPYDLGVFENEECIGWVASKTLGFKTSMDWAFKNWPEVER